MKKSSLEFAALLALKAESDWRIVCLALHDGSSRDAVCFHIQQTAEKLLKALLGWKGVKFSYTHDLKTLLDLVLEGFPKLEEFKESLVEYTPYATALRYDDFIDPSEEETLAAYETVKRLRQIIHSLLPPEVRPK